jgi:hypothetical protein
MKISAGLSLFIITLAILLAVPTTFAGKVYKWVDKNGDVHYGAQKPNSGGQEMKIKSKGSSTVDEEETSTADNSDEENSDSKEDTIKVSSEKEAQALEKKNAKIRKRNCSVAKKRLASITAGGRLYEVNDKGERSYWNDATKAGKRSQAEAQVAEWCK